MKKVLLILAFLAILIAIPVTVFLVRQRQEIRQKAAPATTVRFQPTNVNQNVGDTFTLDVVMDTGTNQVAAAEIHISFSALYLEAQSIQAGDFLPNVFVSGTVDSGSASITVAASPTEPKQGTGNVARLTFKALAATETPTQINFATTTQVSAFDDPGRNVLQSTTPAQVTIAAAGGTPSPTPQVSPSASPGTSPSPTPANQASPTPSPSATPGTGGTTVSPTPSPTTTTKINSPTNGATVTTRLPTISGVSFPNALVIISINSTPQVTSTIYASSTGSWSFTPTADIANGSYTITVTGDDTGPGNPETVTSNFTISASGGTGGTTTASPSPSPTAAAATPTAGSTPAPSASTVPVTATTAPTVMLLGVALLMVILGTFAIFL